MQVKIISQFRCIQNFFRFRGNLSGFGCIGAFGFACGVQDFEIVGVRVISSWSLGLERQNSRVSGVALQFTQVDKEGIF